MEEQYKKTMSGTLGAGMNSLFDSDADYYILEHRVSSEYHKAGDVQEIIVNYIEIGREKDCAVRFDETFKTVSRRHAAIVKDGDSWKLRQLSDTNSTFLNGKKIIDEWYLKNGDEIQLSVNGPKLGFILPNASNREKLDWAKRFKLFKEQALRPYRTLLIIIGVALLLVVGCGVGYGIYINNKNNAIELENMALREQIINQQNQLIDQTEKLILLTQQLDSSNRELYKTQLDALKAKSAAAKNEKDLVKIQKAYNEMINETSIMREEIERIKEKERLEEAARYNERENYLNNKH